MDATLLVAKALGVYLVVGGLFLIIKGKTLPHLIKDFVGHPAMTYLTGALLVVFSAIYLLQYNIWDGSWKTPITVLMWLIFFKGVTYIFAPQTLGQMAIKKSRYLFNTYGLIAIVAGLYLFFMM
jgi:hypothetical protein